VVDAILDREEKDIDTFLRSFWGISKVPRRQKSTPQFPSGDICKTAKEKFSDRTQLGLPELLSKNYVPKTWEEIVALCDMSDWEYLIETRSFDTLLCTFLELVWGCGADLEVDAEYNITITNDFLARFYQAVFLFQELLKHVPEDATLEARVFGEYTKGYPRHRILGLDNAKSDDGKRINKEDWAFMRQWHSTLVDVLVSKDKDDKYLWKPQEGLKPELEMIPLPESFWRFYGERAAGQKKDSKERGNVGMPGHGISCWGDWHLAVLRGSENVKLAVGLLNNLMSSSKVSARALSGAALPSVEEFYKIYRSDPCVHLPERSGDFQMPTTTYGDVKEKYFPIARTRSAIFDYRHVMLEIHGFVVELVYNRHDRKSPEQVSESLNEVFKRINALSERELLLH
jgi:hypothetical protein